MQPETKEQKKEITPVEQWDHLAFQVIYNELAPNGFNRGSQYVKVTKKSVANTQKIAAQLIRGFREKLRKGFTDLSKSRRDEQGMIQAELNACQFWKFKKRRQLFVELESVKAQEDAFQVSINLLNGTDIK